MVRVGNMENNIPLQYCVEDHHGGYTAAEILFDDACLTTEQAESYLCGRDGYGWHISDIKTYDLPKTVAAFGVLKAPQSWCYAYNFFE